MLINQLSVFIENRTGRLDQVLDIIKNENINIISLSLADTSDYGMLRLLVAEPEKAKEALKAHDFSAKLTKIVAVKLPHTVGSLANVLGAICKAGLNIEYMYAISTGTYDAAIAIKTSDLEKTVEVLKETNCEFLTEKQFASMK